MTEQTKSEIEKNKILTGIKQIHEPIDTIDTKGAVIWVCPCCNHKVYEGDDDDDSGKPVGIAIAELPIIICVKCNALSVSDLTIEALTTAMKQASSGIIVPPSGARI